MSASQVEGEEEFDDLGPPPPCPPGASVLRDLGVSTGLDVSNQAAILSSNTGTATQSKDANGDLKVSDWRVSIRTCASVISLIPREWTLREDRCIGLGSHAFSTILALICPALSYLVYHVHVGRIDLYFTVDTTLYRPQDYCTISSRIFGYWLADRCGSSP